MMSNVKEWKPDMALPTFPPRQNDPGYSRVIPGTVSRLGPTESPIHNALAASNASSNDAWPRQGGDQEDQITSDQEITDHSNGASCCVQCQWRKANHLRHCTAKSWVWANSRLEADCRAVLKTSLDAWGLYCNVLQILNTFPVTMVRSTPFCFLRSALTYSFSHPVGWRVTFEMRHLRLWCRCGFPTIHWGPQRSSTMAMHHLPPKSVEIFRDCQHGLHLEELILWQGCSDLVKQIPIPNIPCHFHACHCNLFVIFLVHGCLLHSKNGGSPYVTFLCTSTCVFRIRPTVLHHSSPWRHPSRGASLVLPGLHSVKRLPTRHQIDIKSSSHRSWWSTAPAHSRTK